MTYLQAKQEAKRRWGGGILKRFNARKGFPTSYLVAENHSAFCQWGCGTSWIEAFADADERIKRGDIFSPAIRLESEAL